MVVFAAMFTFAACGGDDTTDPAPKPGNNGTPTKLEKPVVTITDVKEDGFTVTWEAVANATEYLVFLDSKNQPKVTGTSYTFSDLNAGEYKPRVKALGDGVKYTDSDYSDSVKVTVVGLSSVDWFTQTLELAANTEENAAKGVNSSNTVVFTWKGTGVKSIFYSFLYEEDFDLSDATIKSNMSGLGEDEAAWLAEVNSAEGCTLSFGNLPANSQFKLYALVTNNDGKEFFAKSDAIKTDELILTTAAAAFAGKWTVNTPQMVQFAEAGDIVTDEASTFELNITPYENYSKYLVIDGLSVLGEGYPVLGYINYVEDGSYVMYVVNGSIIYEIGNGQYLGWGAFGDVVMPTASGIYYVGGAYPALMFYMDLQGNVETVGYAGELNGGGTFTVTGFDIAVVNSENSVLGLCQFQDENGGEEVLDTFRYGVPQFTEKTAEYTPSAQTQNAKALAVAGVVPVSCVVAM